MARTGRPKKEINQQQFETFCEYQCTQAEICAFLDVTDKTLNAFCRRTYGATFSEVFKQKRERGLVSLRRAQWEAAIEDKNPTMLIFMSKVHLHQSDKQEIEITQKAERDPEYITYKLRRSLFPKQQALFDCSDQLAIASCSRRAGKTVAVSRATVNAVNLHYDEIKKGKETYFFIVAKTYDQAKSLFAEKIETGLKEAGIEYHPDMTHGNLWIGENRAGCVHFAGSDTFDQVDKLRGRPVAFFVIDEAQSQKYGRYLLEEVLLPSLSDFADGRGVLIGTPPRTKGTTFEKYWKSGAFPTFHWTIKDNIYIPNHDTILDEIKEKRGLTDTDPLYRREYLGEFVYDSEALVYHLTDKNYYDEAQLLQFVNEHLNALQIFNGIDYGESDNDALITWLSARDSRHKFLLKDWKQNHNTTAEIVAKIVEWAQFNFIMPEIRGRLPNVKKFKADPGGGGSRINRDAMEQIAKDLTLRSSVLIEPAYKVNKNMAIDYMREDVNAGFIHVPKGCEFDKEAEATVWKRNDDDQIIFEIDDQAYHPDVLDAALYALREKWALEKQETERVLQNNDDEERPNPFAVSSHNSFY